MNIADEILKFHVVIYSETDRSGLMKEKNPIVNETCPH